MFMAATMEVTAYVFCFVVGPAFDVWWKWIFSGQFITCSFTTFIGVGALSTTECANANEK